MGNSKTAAKLRGETGTETATETSAAPSGEALVIYKGRTGRDSEFSHQGSWTVFVSDAGPVKFAPGLNVLDAKTWTKAQKHEPVTTRLVEHPDHGRPLTATSREQLAKLGRSTFNVLARGTTQPEALEVLLRVEEAKPQGNVSDRKRRDEEIVELIRRRLAQARRARPVPLGDIEQAAKDLAIAGTKKAS